MAMRGYDAVIVGSGPNGLAAAVTLAEAGRSVLVIEGHGRIGGGARSAELTLPGFSHDPCSAIHPLGIGSPFFRERPLQRYGLRFRHPPVAVAHPLDDGSAAALIAPTGIDEDRDPAARFVESVDQTCTKLGEDDAAYRKLMLGFRNSSARLLDDLLGPLFPPPIAGHMIKFGMLAPRSGRSVYRSKFRAEPARALFAGCAAHSIMDLREPGTAAFGLVLMVAGHLLGWPCPEGGSQSISDALAAYLQDLGGRVEVGHWVRSLDELPPARAVLFDTAPAAMASIAGAELPGGHQRKLERFAHGPGVFKVDWALDGPIPWTAAECRSAGTVHVGGSAEDVAESERLMRIGQHAERPFVLVAQQSLFAERAPAGKHTGWAYCHVPAGSNLDRTEVIEQQIERFAPGFRDLVLARHTTNCAQLQRYNPNMVGGDVGGGLNSLRQLAARPTLAVNPYATPNPRLFLCSASTPPGGGVHGMCGHLAARSALKRVLA